MSEGQVFPVPQAWADRALITAAGFEAATARVAADPDAHWREIAGRLDWIKPFTHRQGHLLQGRRLPHPLVRRRGAERQRQLHRPPPPHRKDDVAIIWEGDDPLDSAKITYGQLHEEVCRMANVLKSQGVKKGDRVTIYMPMIPQRPTLCWPAPA